MRNKTSLFRYAALGALVLAVACSGGETAKDDAGPEDLRVELDPPAFGYQIHSQPHVVKAGEEYTSCDVVKIEPKDGEKLIWLNSFESRTSAYTHHMNVMGGYFSVVDAILGDGKGEAMLGKKAGQYDCKELGDLMESQGAQTLYPSQNTHQQGTFPKGVGIPAVVPLVLIMQHHYINTTERDVLVDAKVNLVRMEEKDVKYVATGFFGGTGVELPPRSRKIVANTCKIGRDVNLFAISSHSHARGKCFTMNYYDGAAASIDPDPFFVNPDWETPPILFFEKKAAYDHAPLPMKKGDGVHWACHYENPEDRTVRDGGSANDEMCIFVGIGYPSAISVQDIKDIVAHPSLDLVSRLAEEAIIPCDPVTDATSPWPHVNEALPLSAEGAPGYTPLHAVDEDPDACGHYERTVDVED